MNAIYSKHEVLDLFDFLIEDMKDARDDKYSAPSRLYQREGFTGAICVVKSYRQLVEEEW